MIGDYIFTTRDGAERAQSAQIAQTLIQLLQPIMSSEPLMQAVGQEKLYEIINEIFRTSGAGVDLNIEPDQGNGQAIISPNQVAMLGQAIDAITGTIEKLSVDVEQLKRSQQQQSALPAQP